MRKLLIGIMALGSISAFANECNVYHVINYKKAKYEVYDIYHRDFNLSADTEKRNLLESKGFQIVDKKSDADFVIETYSDTIPSIWNGGSALVLGSEKTVTLLTLSHRSGFSITYKANKGIHRINPKNKYLKYKASRARSVSERNEYLSQVDSSLDINKDFVDVALNKLKSCTEYL